MNSARPRYRVYALDSSLDSVLAANGLRAADTRVLHERPAMIQELEWRAPYARSGNELVDPVRGIILSFCDDALYQVRVSYDRDRTDGLSNSDIVASLTTAYGTPVLRSAQTRPLDAPHTGFSAARLFPFAHRVPRPHPSRA